jgi:hypothetical protein
LIENLFLPTLKPEEPEGIQRASNFDEVLPMLKRAIGRLERAEPGLARVTVVHAPRISTDFRQIQLVRAQFTSPLQLRWCAQSQWRWRQSLTRKWLEQRTCECYAVVKREYDRLLPEKLAT